MFLPEEALQMKEKSAGRCGFPQRPACVSAGRRFLQGVRIRTREADPWEPTNKQVARKPVFQENTGFFYAVQPAPSGDGDDVLRGRVLHLLGGLPGDPDELLDGGGGVLQGPDGDPQIPAVKSIQLPGHHGPGQLADL